MAEECVKNNTHRLARKDDAKSVERDDEEQLYSMRKVDYENHENCEQEGSSNFERNLKGDICEEETRSRVRVVRVLLVECISFIGIMRNIL